MPGRIIIATNVENRISHGSVDRAAVQSADMGGAASAASLA